MHATTGGISFSAPTYSYIQSVPRMGQKFHTFSGDGHDNAVDTRHKNDK